MTNLRCLDLNLTGFTSSLFQRSISSLRHPLFSISIIIAIIIIIIITTSCISVNIMLTLREFWKNLGNTSRHIWRPSLLFLCSLLVGCSMFSRWVVAIIVIMIRGWRRKNKSDDNQGKIFSQGDQNLLLENILAPLQLIFLTLATRFITDFLTSDNFNILLALQLSRFVIYRVRPIFST